jgi:CheY-like chemotaxis protein
MRLLVGEDDLDTAEILAELLRPYGHVVRQAHSGLEVLQAALDVKPDAVLLDIGLPDLDGYEVARRLRQLPGFERVPIIAVTGNGREEDKQRSQEAGINRHFVKPVDPDRLEEALKRLTRPPPEEGDGGHW